MDSLPAAEMDAAPLRPVATWVPGVGDDGRRRLTMIWVVPDPRPYAVESDVHAVR